ncbi:MAG: carbamoyltransferase C-terminal domain-containing protein [bacterium]
MDKVLGIHGLCHDSGAALISGDRIVAVSEERLSRVKHDPEFPVRSINYVLKACGVRAVNDIDVMVFSYVERSADAISRLIRDRLKYKGRLHYIRHHDAHAASAFYVSPFEDAAILVIDGCGSWMDEAETGASPHYLSTLTWKLREIQSLYRGDGNHINLIHRTNSAADYSIGAGILYSLGSMILGFGEMGAGKLMALAAYGGRKPVFKSPFFEDFRAGDIIARGLPGADPMMPDNVELYARKLFGMKPRRPGEQITNRHAEFAHFIQKEAEAVMLKLANHLHDITQAENLCVSGGVALNCLANKLILDNTPFRNLFIQPAATDTGIPLGCALHGYHKLLNRPKKFNLDTVFLGRTYTTGEIEAALDKFKGIKWSSPGNIAVKCARLLSEGKVVGRFTGGCELGPRALGNRSILADPRNPKIKDHLDNNVKFRESFRPYAPAVLEEHAREFFDLKTPSPFMLLAAAVHEDKRPLITAVTHVDGTSRIQTVSVNENPGFYKLISEFYKLTGVPLVLNTSMNTAGEPIVETPADALKMLTSTELDCLILENVLVEKK